MADRRGMEAAMSLSPEKRAFIQGGLTPPQLPIKAAPWETRSTEQVQPEPTGAQIDPAPVEQMPTKRHTTGRLERHSITVTRCEISPKFQKRGATTATSSCLSPPGCTRELPMHYGERALSRNSWRKPDTHQEIIEIALQNWLNENQKQRG